jgi:hypothetical protein
VFSARIVDDQRFVVLEPVATDPARYEARGSGFSFPDNNPSWIE